MKGLVDVASMRQWQVAERLTGTVARVLGDGVVWAWSPVAPGCEATVE